MAVTKPKLVLSASQLKTAELCRRKRWLQQVAKLPKINRPYQAFGSVLHSVCERYLAADLLGRDRDGRPVDLYPEGWETAYDRYGKPVGTVNEGEQLLIKMLVEQAIENGYLERRPDGEVEKEFWIPINEGISMMGYIDYISRGRVEDHKTSKIRKYLLSAKKLKDDIQMMVYGGYEVLRFRKRGEMPPAFVDLVHNQFIRGKRDDYGVEEPGIRQTTAKVTPQQIKEFWDERIIPLVMQIAEDAAVEDPFELPDPEPGACHTYGVCEFINICRREESLAHYRARIDKLNADLTVKPTTEPETEIKEPNMDLTELLKNKQAAKAPPAAAQPVAQEPQAQSSNKEPAASLSPNAPPWAVAGCGACGNSSHPGFNTKGRPCQICDLEQSKQGGPVSSNFIIIDAGGGHMVWEEKSEGGTGTTQAIQPAAAPEKRETRVLPEPEPEPKPEPKPTPPVQPTPQMHQPKQVPPAQAEVVSMEFAKDEPRGPGRPKKKPMLLIGCAPLQSKDTTLVEEVLVALRIDEKPYYEFGASVWDRREWVLKNGEGIANGLKGYVVQPVKSPDGDNLVAAIAPYCDVIRGTL